MAPRLIFVEDNVGDFNLMVEAFDEIGFSASTERIADGFAAVQWLESIAPEQHPTMILIDINLPRLDGVEVLKRIRLRNDLVDVPVVMLTSSTSESDQRRCQSADAYFVKRDTWNGCLDLARTLAAFATSTH
jgi:CheY-like chemotaxis protein